MTARQGELLPKPKQSRRKLMHVWDAGGAEQGRAVVVQMRCPRCGHETGWLQIDTVTEAKRGLPCPRCNT